MTRDRTAWVTLQATALAALLAAPAMAQIDQVLRTLNEHGSVHVQQSSKSYPLLFDAYLELDEPPVPVGADFNLLTIHPKMSNWAEVSGWAESHPRMAQAVLECKGKLAFGLPYGAANVEPAYRDAGLVADIGAGQSLRNVSFHYLDAVDTIAAFVTAETYRLMEAGRVEDGLDLAVSHLFVVRQLCDRDFLAEKLHTCALLSNALSVLRDVMLLYQDQVDPDTFTRIAKREIPFLQPDRNHLLMPEGDRVVAHALIEEVFDRQTGADPQRFADAFAHIQAADAPLTRFGAAARWRMIAPVHSSLDASLEQLTLIYDDWWRRWRIQEYDEILDVPTIFERTNPIRYAAVIYSMQNIESLFAVRNQLIADVNGTAMAAGICAYRQEFGNYPNDVEKIYGQFVRKHISDVDPFDMEFGNFRYRRLDTPGGIETLDGLLRLEAGDCVLYSLGQDHEDGRASRHTFDGVRGDIVLWPPVRALQREQGLIN